MNVTCQTSRPTRKVLDHRGPLSIRTTDAVYFITIAAAERGTTALVDKADAILLAARFYQTTAKWFLHLFLIMPDHIHMLVHVPPVDVLYPPAEGCPAGVAKSGAPRNPSATQAALEDRLRSAEDVRPYRGLAKTIGDFKSYLTKVHGVTFQANFFDTRIRDREHFAEKWNYICRNPVAKGLAATAREWPHSIAFDPDTGLERPHR